jgi:hypothetical protein
MNPAAAPRTSPNETGVIPPSANERVVYGASVVFEPEIDGLQYLVTTFVRTACVAIHNMGCH